MNDRCNKLTMRQLLVKYFKLSNHVEMKWPVVKFKLMMISENKYTMYLAEVSFIQSGFISSSITRPTQPIPFHSRFFFYLNTPQSKNRHAAHTI